MSIFQCSLKPSTKVSSSIVLLQEKKKTSKQNKKIYREVESQLWHHYSVLWQATDHTVHEVLTPRMLECFAISSSSEQHFVSWFIGKNPDAGKGWRQKEKEVAEDEMVR